MTISAAGDPSSLLILRRLVQIAKPYGWRILGGIALGIGTVLSGIGLLGTSGYLLSAAALQPSIAELQVAIVAVRFFGISRGLFRYAERLVSHDATLRLLSGLRAWFYQRLEPLAPARLLEYRSGDLLSRIVHDIDILEDFYVRVISPGLVALSVGAFTGLLLGRWDARFAGLYWLLYLIAAFCIPLATGQMAKKAAMDRITLRGELEGKLSEYLRGLADLLVYDPSGAWQGSIESLSQRYERTLRRLNRMTSAADALLNLIQNLTLAAIVWIAIPAVLGGRLDAVFLAVLLLIAAGSFEAVLPLPASSRQWFTSLQAARRLFEVLEAEPSVTDPELPAPIGEASNLQAQQLEFYYPQGRHPALREVSFELQQGEQLGVVGRSGAGKSTLVQLLLRFWDYRNGSLSLNGVEFKDLSQEDLRQRIGVAEQDGYIFEGSIRQNLRLANPRAADAEIREALRTAQALDFVAGFPNGLDTWVGEHGFGLSGGEARRLIIARTLLQDRRLLILDEPTADLDPLTASELMRELQAKMERKLVIWITHRLDGLDFLDQIMVLEGGAPIERGRYAELIRQQGAFFNQWSQQLESALLDTLSRQAGAEAGQVPDGI